MSVPPESPPPGVADATRPAPVLTGEDARVVRLCLTALGVLGSFSIAGVAASLYLVNAAPLALVAMSPIGRHVILVAPIVNPAAFVAVVVTRRMLFYVPCFVLGRTLGPTAIEWVEARARWASRFVRMLERWFDRAGRAVTLLLPGPTVSTLAGISGMPRGEFLLLTLLGLTLRLLLIVGLGQWLRSPIETVLAWIREVRLPGTLVLITGIAIYQWRRRAARKNPPDAIRGPL